MDDRRRSSRFKPEGALYGRIKTTLTARILDISPYGMRVEVPSALRPAAECDVAVPAGGNDLRLRARVLRCRALAGDPTETGGIVFRAGLEFVGVGDEAAAALETAYGKGTESRTKAAGGSWPPRPKGPVEIRVSPDDITRHKVGAEPSASAEK